MSALPSPSVTAVGVLPLPDEPPRWAYRRQGAHRADSSGAAFLSGRARDPPGFV